MRKHVTPSLIAALALVLPASLLPATANAQEEPAEPLVCTAQANVEAVPAGEAAYQVVFELSEDIGPVIGIDSPESGLVVANPEDLPRVDMANPEEEAPKPIQMSLEAENTVILWLNSTNGQAGAHDFWLISEAGSCAATVTVDGG
jgi:hypothetical protein